MTNQPDYRLYLEEKFKGLTTLVNAQFDGIHDRQDKTDKLLDLIHDEAKKTNSRVTYLERERDECLKTRVSTNKLADVCSSIIEVKKTVDIINSDLEEYRIVKKYPKLAMVLIAVFAVGLGISAYGTFRTIGDSKREKILIEKVETLEQRILEYKSNE